jgi:hypothetical protein
MAVRGVSAEEVAETVTAPDKACTGRFRRIVAEKDFGTRVL